MGALVPDACHVALSPCGSPFARVCSHLWLAFVCVSLGDGGSSPLGAPAAPGNEANREDRFQYPPFRKSPWEPVRRESRRINGGQHDDELSGTTHAGEVSDRK